TYQTIRRSERTFKMPQKFVSYDTFSPNFRKCLTMIHSFHEPSSYYEAAQDKNWQKAMDIELEALEKCQTWEMQPLPKGKKAIGCRWVFKVKTKSDGSLERYKARLVAKGYLQ
ncbi:reverse transcriptase domain-containing protein, partial [Klebsiella pneumoniae]|uniref:reverse transcriptase domain-containing protein n=1 Tax=Klebsiella pneumoniae TaxID=573 RepID=UPI003A809F42